MTRKPRTPSKGRLTPEEEALFEDVSPPTLRRLLLAALESFAEHGFEGTTTRDIAGRAEMSSAAIYSHYKSKHDLLFEITLSIHELMVDHMREAFTRTATPRQRLGNLVRVMVMDHAYLHTASRVATNELRSLAPEHRERIAAIRADMGGMVREALRMGAEAGEFTFEDLGVTTVAVVSLAVDICRWFEPAGRLRPAQLADRYVDLVEALVRVTAPASDRAVAARGHREGVAARPRLSRTRTAKAS